MGYDVTARRSYDRLPGILIPWEWQTRSATATGVHHATPTPGPDSYAGSGRARLQLTGAPSYTDAAGDPQVPAVIDVVSVPGVAGDGLGWAWRRDGDSHWYGQERPTIVTDWQSVGTSGAYTSYAPSILAASDGSVYVVHAYGTGSGGVIEVRRRTGPVWDDAAVNVGVTVVDLPAGLPASLIEMPDGTLLLMTLASWYTSAWALAVYMSTDSGATWEEQSTEALTWTADPPRLMRAAVLDDGRVVLAMTEQSGSSSQVRTAVSADVGVTWRQIEIADDAALGGVVVWDLRLIKGALVAVVEAGVLGAGALTGIGWREVGDPETAWVAGTSTDTVSVIYTPTGSPRWTAGGCVADAVGADGYLVIIPQADDVTLWRTDAAAGQSVAHIGGGDDTINIAQIQAAWWRGALCVACARRVDTALDTIITELRLGGGSDLTWTGDYFSSSAIDDPLGWINTRELDGYSTSDDTSGGGSVTRSWSKTTGQRIVTTGALGRHYDVTIDSSKGYIAQGARVRVAAGVYRVELKASYPSNSYHVYVDVSPTQIRIGDATAGTWSSWTSHGATSADYLTVEATIHADVGGATARCYWQTDALYPATRTGTLQAAGLTATNPSTATIIRFGAEASSDVYLLWVWSSARFAVVRRGISDLTAATSLVGIPLSLAEPRYLADGLAAQVIGGMPRAETGVVHRSVITGAAPYEHMWPEVVASPRWGWIMPADQDAVITLRPTPSGTAARTAPSEIFGIYLGGMEAVRGFVLAGFAYDASIDVDLRTPYRYAGNGYSVTGAATGGATEGRWVGQDELVGCLLECEDGLRRIVGNSPGSLHSGETIGEVRAVLHLDGTPGVDGLGYIWPRTAMVLVYDTDSRDWPGEITLTIDSADDAPGDTRTIGTLAAGYVQPMGMQWDRTESHEYTIGDAVERMPDGTSYTTSQDPGRRRIEVSLTESPHDLSETYGPASTDSSADYLVVPAPGSSLPGADADPLGMVWSMIAARGRKPVVLAHMTRSDDGGGKVVVQALTPHRDGTWYARVAGDPRWQRVPLQSELAQWGRLTTIAFEEIT